MTKYVWGTQKIHLEAKGDPHDRWSARAKCGAYVGGPVYSDSLNLVRYPLCTKCFPIPPALKVAAPRLLAMCKRLSALGYLGGAREELLELIREAEGLDAD